MKKSNKINLIFGILIFLIVFAFVAYTITDDLVTGETPRPKIHDKRFECENDNGVKSRGYVFLMGLYETLPNAYEEIRKIMESDPKAKFVKIYGDDGFRHIDEISNQFVKDVHSWIKEQENKGEPIEELIIFGASAGGVTASYSIAKINFTGHVAVHTLSSPINGYDLTGFRARFIDNRQGYLQDISIGFEPFEKPGNNVKVYHHKTVTDTILIDHYCSNTKFFCDTLKVQNNNIEGSKDFYYPQYDHNPLIQNVTREVLKCYK